MGEPNPPSLPQRLAELKLRSRGAGAPTPPLGDPREPSPVRPLDEVLSTDLGLRPDAITQIMEAPEEERLAMLQGVMPERLREAAATMAPADRLALHRRFKAITDKMTAEAPPAAPARENVLTPSKLRFSPNLARPARTPATAPGERTGGAGKIEASEGSVDQVIYRLFWSAGISYSEVAGITDRGQLAELVRQKEEGQVQGALGLQAQTGEDKSEAIARITQGFGILNLFAEVVSLPIGPLPRTEINNLLVEMGVAPEKLIGQPPDQIVQKLSEEVVAAAGGNGDALRNAVDQMLILAGLQESGFFSWSDLSNLTGSTPHAGSLATSRPGEPPPPPRPPAPAEVDRGAMSLERELSDYGLFKVLGYSTRVPSVSGAADINHVLQMYRVANENLDSGVTAALEADPHDPDALARRDAYARVRAEINRRFPDDASLRAELQRVPLLGDELPAGELLARLKLNPGDLTDKDLASPYAINLALQNQVRRIGHEVDAAIRANPHNLIAHELVDEQIDAFESLMKKYNADPAAFIAELRGTPEPATAFPPPAEVDSEPIDRLHSLLTETNLRPDDFLDKDEGAIRELIDREVRDRLASLRCGLPGDTYETKPFAEEIIRLHNDLANGIINGSISEADLRFLNEPGRISSVSILPPSTKLLISIESDSADVLWSRFDRNMNDPQSLSTVQQLNAINKALRNGDMRPRDTVYSRIFQIQNRKIAMELRRRIMTKSPPRIDDEIPPIYKSPADLSGIDAGELIDKGLGKNLDEVAGKPTNEQMRLLDHAFWEKVSGEALEASISLPQRFRYEQAELAYSELVRRVEAGTL